MTQKQGYVWFLPGWYADDWYDLDMLRQDDTNNLTYNVKESEQLAKEVAIGPPVVILQVVIQVVQKEFLLLLFLHLGDNSDVEIHHEGGNFAGLPVLP